MQQPLLHCAGKDKGAQEKTNGVVPVERGSQRGSGEAQDRQENEREKRCHINRPRSESPAQRHEEKQESGPGHERRLPKGDKENGHGACDASDSLDDVAPCSAPLPRSLHDALCAVLLREASSASVDPRPDFVTCKTTQ